MRHDQVWLYVRTSREGLVDGVRMPDGVLERPAAIVVLLRGTAANLVGHNVDPGHVAWHTLGTEGAAPALVLYQVRCNMPKLGGEVLVDEKEVHADTPAVRVSTS